MEDTLTGRANKARINERAGIKYFAELGVMYHDNIALITAQQVAIESLTAQLEEATKALEFYADDSNWYIADTYYHTYTYLKDEDDGDIAKQALSTIRGK